MNPEDSRFFSETMSAYRKTKSLLVANKLGIFDALKDGPQTAEDLARDLGCSGPQLEQLLNGLTSQGLLIKGEFDNFENGPLAVRCLVSGSPDDMTHNLRFQDQLWDCWSNLEAVVKTGSPHRSLPDLIEETGSGFVAEYIKAMNGFSKQAAEEVASILGQSEPRALIDVGAGAGTYSAALLRTCPSLSATLIDLPGTLAVTREIVRQSGCHDRMTFVTGDYHQVAYGQDADLVLMSHVTHDEGPDEVRAMFEKAHRALSPGGKLAVHDWVVDESKTRPAPNVMFSMNLMVYTERGRIYSRDEYRRLLAEAGFEPTMERLIGEGDSANPTTLIVATRSGSSE